MNPISKGRALLILLAALLLVGSVLFPQYKAQEANAQMQTVITDEGKLPTDMSGLYSWLDSDAYQDWTSEDSASATSSPHGDAKIFYNVMLERAFIAGDTDFPVGAASVMELYTNGELTGWAAKIRHEAASDSNSGWYFYDLKDQSHPDTAEAGYDLSQCTMCHSEATGIIASSYPLTESVEVPTDSADMFAWLKRGHYLEWDHESGVHPSTGPHGDVLTYINPVLEQSFMNGNTTHPIGAAAVKELYDNGEVMGWDVLVKVANADSDGQNWYWYQIKSTTDGSSPDVAGTGVTGCSGCHSAGVDEILTPYPLQ